MTRNVKDFPDIELPEVTPQQAKVIELLLCGQSQAQAAEQAGVTPTTVSRWRNLDANFIGAYNAARLAQWQQSQHALFLLRDSAIDTLSELMESDDEKIKFETAKLILSSVEKPSEKISLEKVQLDIQEHHSLSKLDDMKAKFFPQRSKTNAI